MVGILGVLACHLGAEELADALLDSKHLDMEGAWVQLVRVHATAFHLEKDSSAVRLEVVVEKMDGLAEVKKHGQLAASKGEIAQHQIQHSPEDAWRKKGECLAQKHSGVLGAAKYLVAVAQG